MQFIAQLFDWTADICGRADAALSVVGQAAQEVATTAVEKVKEIVPDNIKTFVKETAQRIESAPQEIFHYIKLGVLGYVSFQLGYCFINTLAVLIPVLLLLSTVFLVYFIKGLFIGMALAILLLEIKSHLTK